MLKELLGKKEFKKFYKELIVNINKLGKQIQSVAKQNILNKMGFPKNYMKLLNIN